MQFCVASPRQIATLRSKLQTERSCRNLLLLTSLLVFLFWLYFYSYATALSQLLFLILAVFFFFFFDVVFLLFRCLM